MLELKVKPLIEGFITPCYATDGAAGIDFHAHQDGDALAGNVTKIALGCAVEIPPGKALLITARSGHGAKFGAGVPHGYGLIDSDYRGELFMVFVTEKSFYWSSGDRIAQGVLVDAPQCAIRVVDELSDTARGTGGLGSTGSAPLAATQAPEPAVTRSLGHASGGFLAAVADVINEMTLVSNTGLAAAALQEVAIVLSGVAQTLTTENVDVVVHDCEGMASCLEVLRNASASLATPGVKE